MTLDMHDSGATSTRELGARLQKARETAGLTLAQAAAQARLPQRTLQRFESGDWSRESADVFQRGQLRAYARQLGIDTGDWFTAQATAATAPLITHQRTPPMQRFADNIGRKMVYAVITATVLVPVWLAVTRSPVAGAPPAVSIETPASHTAPALARASIAALPAVPEAVPAVGAQALTVHFDGDSWMEAIAPDGRALARGTVKAGDTRQFAAGQVARLKLGNASHLRVERAGVAVDITPFIRSDVARFAVSSEGQPQAPD